MDGMNQNNNNPYGQQEQGGYPQQSGPYQAHDPYDHNPYRQNEGEGQPAPQPQNYGQQGYQAQGLQQQDYQQQGGFGTPPIHPYVPRGQRYGRKIAIGAACVLAVLIVAGIGALAYYRSRPAYRIAGGFRNLAEEIGESENPLSEKIGLDDIAAMMREDGSHVETGLDLTVNIPYLGETTLGIDTDFSKDMHAKELNAETALSVMNYDFAHLNLYADEEVFCFSLPELFLEDMYIKNENVVSQYNGSVLAGDSPVDMEDFSIDLFAQTGGSGSLRDEKNWADILEGIESDLSACHKAMTMEKVEKGVYRVTIPQKESDRLLKSVIEHYGELTGSQEELDAWKEYKTLILSDVSLLFEIDRDNRIGSIMLEEPVELLDGAGRLEAEVFFLGEERSIDKIQGKLKADGVDGVEREVIGQLQQTADEERYRMDIDLKLNEEDKTLYKVKIESDSDAVRDEASLSCSVRNEWSEMKFVLESSIDEYEPGESVEISLDKAALSMDGEDLLKLTGDVSIEPLQGEIEPSASPETAFFELSWEEWYDIMEQIDDEYGGLLGSLLW